MKTILSLCDYTGNWSLPYREAGYRVVLVDIKHGLDVHTYVHDGPVHGILMAPPCTEFAASGARYWKQKDADGRTLKAVNLIVACVKMVNDYRPEFWCLENPVGRLNLWLGEPALRFDPCDYGDPYTKKTCLWGNFNIPEKTPVAPMRYCTQGSWTQKLGGKSERTKTLRAATPMGFARAFFKANP